MAEVEQGRDDGCVAELADLPASLVPCAEHEHRLPGQERRQQPIVIVEVILQVGILDHNNVTRRD